MQKRKLKGFQKTVSVRDKNLGHLTQKSMTLSSSLPFWDHPAKDTGWLCKAGWVCAVVCPPPQGPLQGWGPEQPCSLTFPLSSPVTAIKREVGRPGISNLFDPFSSLDGSISAHSPSPSQELLGWGRQCRTWAQRELWSTDLGMNSNLHLGHPHSPGVTGEAKVPLPGMFAQRWLR